MALGSNARPEYLVQLEEELDRLMGDGKGFTSKVPGLFLLELYGNGWTPKQVAAAVLAVVLPERDDSNMPWNGRLIQFLQRAKRN